MMILIRIHFFSQGPGRVFQILGRLQRGQLKPQFLVQFPEPDLLVFQPAHVVPDLRSLEIGPHITDAAPHEEEEQKGHKSNLPFAQTKMRLPRLGVSYADAGAGVSSAFNFRDPDHPYHGS